MHCFSVEIVPVSKDSVICLPHKLTHQLGGISPLCLVHRVTNCVHLIDPATTQSKSSNIVDVSENGNYIFTTKKTTKRKLPQQELRIL
jgi:NMD protein affecting ribosome stability and mRNA decay